MSLRKYNENKEYEIVPDIDTDHWLVRVLEGDYSETVIKFGRVRIDNTSGVEEEVELKYDFEIIESVDDISVEDKGLQSFASDLLYSIIETAIETKDQIYMKEVR